ncbi:MAG: hypothetical protein H6819_00830 [Phycisphaerales bacterium]|nr:hypothetical protein [Phycisphaerales bacterium]MCB9857248.1 hypothetical protein [Phycisphaerales bacterium]MCB9863038.1 hypothetical protein [Phycisphaerales bacterium]
MSSLPVRSNACPRPIAVALTFVIALPACFAAPNEEPDTPPLLRRPPEPFVGPIDDKPDPPIKDMADQQISEYIREVFQDRDGVYWFGTNGDGLARYDGESLKYISVKDGLAGSAIRGILQAPDGAMWFATEGGVSRYAEGKFTNHTIANGLSDNEVWCIFRDRAGIIWAGTHEGVCRFDGKTWTPFPLPRIDVTEPESRFTPKVVFCIFQDRSGNLWFGTDGEGVHRYDGKSFTSYTTKEGLAGNLVRSIAGDRLGRIWIGTEGGGVSCFNGRTFRNFTSKDGLNNDRIFEILEDRSGNMWFSTLGAGACRYDGKTFRAFAEDPNLIINGRPARSHVQEFFEDRDGVLWLGCSGGLFRLDGERIINVTREGPWPSSPKKPAANANPLEHFAQMILGEWRLGLINDAIQSDTWGWGPGRRSLVARTVNSRGDGETTSGVCRVLYWHPGRKKIAMLALLWQGMIGEGTATIKGDNARFDYILHYPTHPSRKLILDWKFDGPNKYRSTLLEIVGEDDPFELASWDYVRTDAPTPPAANAKATPPSTTQHVTALKPLVGHTWAATGIPMNGRRVDIQSHVDWIPHVEAIHARIVEPTQGGEPEHLFDTYVYHHTGTNSLHCLALSNLGAVYEGDVNVLDDGALQLELTGYEDDAVIRRLVRFDFEKDGSLRHRAWSVSREGRTLLFDVYHRIA